MARMEKLNRLVSLILALGESSEGLTLDEMAELIQANRRTAERMRDVIRLHFDLEEMIDDKVKRFRISGSLPGPFTQPSTTEFAALETQVAAARERKSADAELLESLRKKVFASLRTQTKTRLAPDREPLVAMQRHLVPAGPALDVAPETLATIQGAMIAGSCVEFDYRREGESDAVWRRVVPLGLLFGATTYLVGQIPDSQREPVPYRLDRIGDARPSNRIGYPPPDWDLDGWLGKSFGIWREEPQEVVLRVDAKEAERARNWRFHPEQELTQDGDELVVRFMSGGLWELADHIFSWNGAIRIEAPEELRDTMRSKLMAAQATLG